MGPAPLGAGLAWNRARQTRASNLRISKQNILLGLLTPALIILFVLLFQAKIQHKMRDFEVYWQAGTRAIAAESLYRTEDGHKDLAGRGLKGVKLVVSDDHAGLRAARRAVFPALPWQRCQFHLSQNAQRFARRLEERGEIGQAMRDIFNSPTLEDAEAMLKRKIQAFAETNQALAQWMEENVREGLTVLRLPPKPAPEDPDDQGRGESQQTDPPPHARGGNLPPYRLGVATDLGRAGGDSRRVAHGPVLSEPGEPARNGGILELG